MLSAFALTFAQPAHAAPEPISPAEGATIVQGDVATFTLQDDVASARVGVRVSSKPDLLQYGLIGDDVAGATADGSAVGQTVMVSDTTYWATTETGPLFWQPYRLDCASSITCYVPGPVRSLNFQIPACSDGLDNDDDGQLDEDDFGCDEGAKDLSERLVRLPTLALRDATRYARRAAGLKFKQQYHASYARRFRCARLSRIKARCRASWILGDLGYTGRIQVWYKKQGERVAWWYSLKIYRLDEYCAIVTPERKCLKTYVVH